MFYAGKFSLIVIQTGKLLSRITYDSEMIANSSSSSLVTIVREGAYFNFIARGDVLYQLGIDVGSFSSLGQLLLCLFALYRKSSVSLVKTCKILWGN